jgi:hypothetical protein
METRWKTQPGLKSLIKEKKTGKIVATASGKGVNHP